MCINTATGLGIPCLICHSKRQHKLLRHKKDRFIKKIACDVITFVLCESCGFAFQSPQPNQQSLDTFYKQGEFELETSDKYFKESRLDAQKKIAWLGSRLSNNAKGRVLEIGSSAGFLLHALQDDGWDVFGVEPSLPFSRYAKENLGLNVRVGFLDVTTFPTETFDLIIALHVIEHTTNPVAFLNLVRSKLSRNGMVFIEVPNIYTMRADRSIYDYFCSIHMMMFTPITIYNLLSKAGFQVIAREITDRGISILAKPGRQINLQKESTKRIKAALWKHQMRHALYLLKKISSRAIRAQKNI